MTSDRHRRIEALFEAALQQDPADRNGWLADACTDDAALRAEVDALLAAHGTLHLLGFDHETRADDRAMRRMERQALRAVGLETAARPDVD